ncbi:hypothetical protein T484DRAFT_1647618, partial [Baffinella frigidus]
CNAGYTAASNGTVCNACGIGTYKDSTGPGLCVVCPPRTNSDQGAAVCPDTLCPDGNHWSETHSCDICPVNKFCANGVLEQCMCLAGYYGASDGVECTPCVGGTFKNSTGPGLCVVCPPRTNSDQGATVCPDTPCPDGNYWSETHSCDICPVNKFCANGVLFACPVHTESDAASSAVGDCTCEPGSSLSI